MNINAVIQRHLVAIYFGLAFTISSISSFAAAGPNLFKGKEAIDAMIVHPGRGKP